MSRTSTVKEHRTVVAGVVTEAEIAEAVVAIVVDAEDGPVVVAGVAAVAVDAAAEDGMAVVMADTVAGATGTSFRYRFATAETDELRLKVAARFALAPTSTGKNHPLEGFALSISHEGMTLRRKLLLACFGPSRDGFQFFVTAIPVGAQKRLLTFAIEISCHRC